MTREEMLVQLTTATLNALDWQDSKSESQPQIEIFVVGEIQLTLPLEGLANISI